MKIQAVYNLQGVLEYFLVTLKDGGQEKWSPYSLLTPNAEPLVVVD